MHVLGSPYLRRPVMLILVCVLAGLQAQASEELPFDRPVQAQGRVMFPVAQLARWLGAAVEYQAGQITVVGGREVVMKIGSRTARVDGAETMLDVAPLLGHRGKAYVPARFLVEVLGGAVRVEPSSHRLIISLGTKEGYAIMAAESLPLKYSYAGLSNMAKRQEKLGDASGEAGQITDALWHYATAKYAALDITCVESLDNPLIEARRHMMAADLQSNTALKLAEVGLESASTFARLAWDNQQLAEDELAKARSSGKYAKYERSMERHDTAGAIADRVRAKADKLRLNGHSRSGAVAEGALQQTDGSAARERGPLANEARLTLGGIVEGSPRIATIRAGREHYIVVPGDTIRGFKVEAITSDEVVLMGSEGRLVLRLPARAAEGASSPSEGAHVEQPRPAASAAPNSTISVELHNHFEPVLGGFVERKVTREWGPLRFEYSAFEYAGVDNPTTLERFLKSSAQVSRLTTFLPDSIGVDMYAALLYKMGTGVASHPEARIEWRLLCTGRTTSALLAYVMDVVSATPALAARAGDLVVALDRSDIGNLAFRDAQHVLAKVIPELRQNIYAFDGSTVQYQVPAEYAGPAARAALAASPRADQPVQWCRALVDVSGGITWTFLAWYEPLPKL